MVKISLRLQTIVIFLLLSIIPLIIVSFLSIETNKEALENEIYLHLEAVAKSKADHIETFFQLKKEAITDLSKSIVIRTLLNSEKTDPDYNSKLEEVHERLTGIVESKEITYSAIVLDLNGIIVASNNPEEIGLNKSSDSLFIEGKKGIFIKDAHIPSHAGTEINTITFSAPVFHENKIIGIVAKKNLMTQLDKITSETTGLGNTGEIYIVNKDKFLITNTRVLKDTFLKTKIETKETAECFGEKTKEEKSVYKDYLDIEVLGTHIEIPEMNWCLIAEINEKEAFEPIQKSTKMFITTAIVILILIIILSFFYSNYLTKPIKKLNYKVNEITKGKLNIKLEKTNIKEISEFTDSLNRILTSLKLAVLKVGIKKQDIGLGEAIKAKEVAESISQKRTEQLAKFARVSVGREEQMIELKKRINELNKKLGKKPEFTIPSKKEADEILKTYLDKQAKENLKEKTKQNKIKKNKTNKNKLKKENKNKKIKQRKPR